MKYAHVVICILLLSTIGALAQEPIVWLRADSLVTTDVEGSRCRVDVRCWWS